MVNSKETVPLCELIRASRHTLFDEYLGYIEPDEEAHSKHYRPMASKIMFDDDKKVHFFCIVLFM